MTVDSNWLEFFQDRERLHADFYLNFTCQHAHRNPTAHNYLEADSGNVLRTATWLHEADRAEDILKLATALWHQSDFMRTRGFMQRGLPLLEQAWQAASRLGDKQAELIWLEALAQAQLNLGNPVAAQPLYEQALTLAQVDGDSLFIARVQLGLGRLLIELSQLAQANITLKQALETYTVVDNYDGKIETLIALGNLLTIQEDYSGAVAYIQQGLSLAQARRDYYGETALYFALGYASGEGKEWLTAIYHYNQAVQMAHEVGNRLLEVRGLHNMGEAWLELGYVEHAITLLEEAVTCQHALDDALTKAFTHFYLGKAYHAYNTPNDSLTHLRQVLIFHQIPNTIPLAIEALWLEVDNYLKLSQFDRACLTLRTYLNFAALSEAQRSKGEALLQMLDDGHLIHTVFE